MSEYIISAVVREEINKQTTKKLRREERVPAVFYSSSEKTLPISVDLKEFRSAIHSGSHIFALKIGSKTKKCVIRDIQHDPVSEEILHADFLGVRLKETITVEVPVRIEGTAIGVKEFGGILEQNLWTLEVKCMVSDIPDSITIDVSELNIGDTIHIGDIALKNFEILESSSTSVVSIVKATGAKADEEEEEEILEEEEETEEQEE